MCYRVFIQNKYTHWYKFIIESAKNNSKDLYMEQHHIVPKSIKGTNESSNLIYLTPRQHFICHWLLTKMVVDKKDIFRMANAFNLMLRAKNPYQNNRYTITGRRYDNARKLCNEKLSGENSPFYGVPKTQKHRKNISKGRRKFIKNGGTVWNKGVPMREESKAKLRIQRAKQIITEEQKIKQSKSMTGKKWYNNGIDHILAHSDDVRLTSNNWKLGSIMSSKRPVKILHCIHCNKDIAGAGNFSRWHGNKCKSKY